MIINIHTSLWKRKWHPQEWRWRQKSGLHRICSAWVEAPSIPTPRGYTESRTSKSNLDDLWPDLTHDSKQEDQVPLKPQTVLYFNYQ